MAPRTAIGVVEPVRLTREERRETLLDTAAALMVSHGIDRVTMDSVAEAAGVSRPLVYKHFSNRRELVTGVYRREAAVLHDEMAAAVRAAEGLEAKFRALIHGALKGEAERGAALSALRAAGGRDEQFRNEQKARDRGTTRYFSRIAAQAYGLDEYRAGKTVSILLRCIQGVLAEWHLRPTAQHAAVLEDSYVGICMGALDRLAGS